MARPYFQIHVEPKPVKIARLIGMRDAGAFDDVRLFTEIEKGLAVSAVEDLASRIAPGDRTFKYLIASRSTLDRMKAQKKRRLSKSISSRVYELAKIWGELLDTFGGDADRSKRFLETPHLLLGNKKPLEVALGSTAGADTVLDLLKKAQAGVAV